MKGLLQTQKLESDRQKSKREKAERLQKKKELEQSLNGPEEMLPRKRGRPKLNRSAINLNDGIKIE